MRDVVGSEYEGERKHDNMVVRESAWHSNDIN